MEFLNRKLAHDPNRKISWDKWPPYIGLLYLIAKIRFNRSNALTDPYDYAANDTKPRTPEPEAARKYYSADGAYVSDSDDPQMGEANTRFSSNIPPKKVRPDPENMTPPARGGQAALAPDRPRHRQGDHRRGADSERPGRRLDSVQLPQLRWQYQARPPGRQPPSPAARPKGGMAE